MEVAIGIGIGVVIAALLGKKSAAKQRRMIHQKQIHRKKHPKSVSGAKLTS